MIVVEVTILAVSTLSTPVAISEVPSNGPFLFKVSLSNKILDPLVRDYLFTTFPVCFSSLCLYISFSAKSEGYWKAFVI